jgi:asparagine synthase (glutamine-hydrolysing)
MCSILGVFDLRPGADLTPLRPLALSLSAMQRHRGPDWSGVHAEPAALLVHERLAIVDPSGGAQPIRSGDGELVLAVNGEIYNHRELEQGLGGDYRFTTGSDCEVLNALHAGGEPPEAWLARVNGIFAFVLWDRRARRIVIARDHMGICPLYWGHDADGRLWVASEIKAIARMCPDVALFPPGHVHDSARGAAPVQWYHGDWREYDAVRGVGVDKAELRQALEEAVHRQLMGSTACARTSR